VCKRNLEDEEANARYWVVENTTTMGCNARRTNNNNNGIINNNYGRVQGLISLLKIPIVTRKNFFEIYRQFGHASSKIFARPLID
jgi:hypothetical protein